MFQQDGTLEFAHSPLQLFSDTQKAAIREYRTHECRGRRKPYIHLRIPSMATGIAIRSYLAELPLSKLSQLAGGDFKRAEFTPHRMGVATG